VYLRAPSTLTPKDDPLRSGEGVWVEGFDDFVVKW